MAKIIMIQGTMSNVGKSLLAAGLCRIFRQDGYRVAPFKSQNMALNSYITDEGLEMGRAQVMQAEAAGIRPSVLMNPILLKPTNDTGSQVIVNGEVLGNYSAREYFSFKKKLIPDILKAFHVLASENDIIVIEGAGSPAEINLKQDDIVNMGLAKLVHAPVLLVGDIDRGGVFAQLLGTLELLEEDERSLVKGLIINKFRGDKSILDPGIAMLEMRAGIPVAGVTPYLRIEVDDEDSLSERFTRADEVKAVDIAVIRLPRISNFTDFNPFEMMDDVSLRYVDRVSQLKTPDMIILPGTKNTMGDLRWLRQSGLEAAILKAAAAGTVIMGICGGFQMLGESIADPSGAEEGGAMRGMGLLPARTVFSDSKVRTRVTGRMDTMAGVLSPLSGLQLEGYEIHMGTTSKITSETSVGMTSGTTSETSPGACCRPLTKIAVQSQGAGAAKWQAPGMESAAVSEGVYADDHEDMCADGTAGAYADDHEDMYVDGTAGACADSHEDMCADGLQRGNVYGTYVHGIFDREEIASGIVRALGAAKGVDISSAGSHDAAAFRQTQYDLLASALREHLDMPFIYRLIEEAETV